MKPNPPRWFGLTTLFIGLYVFAYLALTEGNIMKWIFPTGIVAITMIIAGLRWSFRQLR